MAMKKQEAVMESFGQEVVKANLFVIAAPSGTGKTSLVKELVASLPQISVSVSYTTRPMRPGDQDGVDYNFVDREQFEASIAAGEFLEYAKVYDHYYGTSRSWVKQQLAEGTDIILEIDWQGAQQIRRDFAQQAVLVFILPPSIEDLLQRLQQRQQDSAEVMTKRMLQASSEMAHCHEFDYLLVNDDFQEALHALQSIVKAQRLTTKRQLWQQKEVIAGLFVE